MAGWDKGVPLLLGVLPVSRGSPRGVRLPAPAAKVLPLVKASVPVGPVKVYQSYHARVVA